MSSTPSTFRLGVLGLGEGRSILSAALASERWRIAKICDLDADRCRQRVKEFGEMAWTTSYAEMLADPEVETVAIFTPDALHAEHIRMALEAGKHVICTKPLLVDLAPAGELLRLAERVGRQVFVGQSTRFFEPFMRQREDEEDGRHGRLLSVECHYHGDKRKGTSGRWGRSGGVDWMFTGLSHPMDLLFWHLGPIEEVYGHGLLSPSGEEQGQKTPDMLHCLVRSCSGAIGTVSGCYGVPEAPITAEPSVGCVLRGTAGVSEARYPELAYHAHFDGEADRVENFVLKRGGHYFRFGGFGHHAGEFQNYLDYFARCLDAGETPRPNIKDGVEVVAALHAAKESIRSGKAVRVADILDRAGLLAMVRPSEKAAAVGVA